MFELLFLLVWATRRLYLERGSLYFMCIASHILSNLAKTSASTLRKGFPLLANVRLQFPTGWDGRSTTLYESGFTTVVQCQCSHSADTELRHAWCSCSQLATCTCILKGCRSTNQLAMYNNCKDSNKSCRCFSFHCCLWSFQVDISVYFKCASAYAVRTLVVHAWHVWASP